MKTQALKGMRDLLPAEQTLRDYIQGKILETYRASGFERISTPMLEDMENLDKSDGGDNLNLIFKVLKRGDKLTAALNTGLQIFDIDHVIAELSQGMTLRAGTIIATGTPAGVGMGMDPPRFLVPGDEVRCEIEGIGTLTNTVR